MTDGPAIVTVAVIAKQPLPGKVKTRLITPTISATDAAMLAQCCVRDTLSALANLDVRHRIVILDGQPGSWLPAGWQIQPQSSGLLDERLSSGFDALPPGPAVLVGMDTPQLRADQLQFDPHSFDACLGMATDGGYWAIGFRDPSLARSVISGVPMSRSDTGEIQLTRMLQAGLRVQMLPTLTDVDTAASAQEVSELVPDSSFGLCWRSLCGSAATAPGWDLPELSAYAGALRRAADLELVTADGRVVQLDIQRYLAAADVDDATVIERVIAPVLDVGCGPGRIVHALAAAGMPALGVDVADVAVELTTDRGAPALNRSVFDRIPGEGRWPTVLVLDGNIGIGGNVDSLLRRLLQLMAPDGQMIIETSPEASDDVLSVRFGCQGESLGPVFSWAVLDRFALIRHASRLGLIATDQWSAGGRDFVRLARNLDSA